jgi:hypothetical protein
MVAKGIIAMAAVLIGLVLVGLLIYPGLYIYGHTDKVSHPGVGVYRVNRITGIYEWSTNSGWVQEELPQVALNQ